VKSNILKISEVDQLEIAKLMFQHAHNTIIHRAFQRYLKGHLFILK